MICYRDIIFYFAFTVVTSLFMCNGNNEIIAIRMCSSTEIYKLTNRFINRSLKQYIRDNRSRHNKTQFSLNIFYCIYTFIYKRLHIIDSLRYMYTNGLGLELYQHHRRALSIMTVIVKVNKMGMPRYR